MLEQLKHGVSFAIPAHRKQRSDDVGRVIHKLRVVFGSAKDTPMTLVRGLNPLTTVAAAVSTSKIRIESRKTQTPATLNIAASMTT